MKINTKRNKLTHLTPPFSSQEHIKITHCVNMVLKHGVFPHTLTVHFDRWNLYLFEKFIVDN